MNWNSLLGNGCGEFRWHASPSVGSILPRKIKRAAIIAATAQTSPQNIALNEVARQIIRKDSSFNNGEYITHNTTPKEGLKTARMWDILLTCLRLIFKEGLEEKTSAWNQSCRRS